MRVSDFVGGVLLIAIILGAFFAAEFGRLCLLALGAVVK
jgi:hypothetical protein